MTSLASGACICDAVPSVDVGGIPVHPSSPSAALVHLESFLACGACHVVNHVAVDAVVQAWDNPALLDAFQRAHLNLADGMPVVWASRLLGGPGQGERVYGPDFVCSVAAWGLRRDLRHAFLGGADAGVLEALVAQLRARFPGLAVASAYSPPLRDVSPEGVASDILNLRGAATSPIDVLWVGLGTPKQQLWADVARLDRVAPAIMTVGAAFDFISGHKPQAPRWLGRIGLEWTFRLASEPRRLWRRYLLGNPRFVSRVAEQWSRTRWKHDPSTL